MRLGELITLQSGQDLLPTEYNCISNGIPYITGASNFTKDGSIIINRWTINPKTKASKGDLLLSCKGTVGKLIFWNFDSEVHIARQVMGIRSYLLSSFYLKFYLEYMIQKIIKSSKGLIPGIERKDILLLSFPLPPLAEQKRIVETVDNIFAKLDVIDNLQEKYLRDKEVLKSKLLDAAVSGKLTKQLKEDGDARDLYKKIQEEKAKLIKQGKIKKEKPLPEITQDEIPFDIPKNWMWVRLGALFNHNAGKALNSSNRKGTLLEYVTTSNVYWDHFELSNLKKMYFKDEELEKYTIKKNDLLICEGGDIGRSAIWCFDFEMRIQNHIHKLRAFINKIIPKFYYYMMRSYKDNDLINGHGIGLQGFSSNRVHSLIVPLPPLAEQKRIVEKLDAIMKLL